ncbi:MAG: recombinase family protein, partial [Candidatus Dormibacteria bacterium]
MEINPAEAAVVLRIFQQYSEGASLPGIVRSLNDDRVPGRVRATLGWSPATVSRILDNEKYVGRWVWNKTENRRDPRTGRKRQFDKPESEWIVQESDELRIVPGDLWQKVREHREQARRAWPVALARRGFSSQQGSRQKTYPTHLLSGAMVWGSCGAAMAQVSGKSGGYYGCLAATKGACDNHLLVRRTLAERVIIEAVRERLADAGTIR